MLPLGLFLVFLGQPLLFEGPALEASHDGLVKHLLEVFLRERRRLDVAKKSEASGQFLGLGLSHWSLLDPGQLDQGGGIVSEVGLGSHKDHGGAVFPLRTRFPDLVDPLFPIKKAKKTLFKKITLFDVKALHAGIILLCKFSSLS